MTLYRTVAVALVAASLGAAGAWRVQGWRFAALERDRLAAEAELRRNNAKAADQAAAGHEADKAAIRTQFVPITQEVERVVEKPVYRAECFDADGLRILRAAASEPAAAGQPAPSLP